MVDFPKPQSTQYCNWPLSLIQTIYSPKPKTKIWKPPSPKLSGFTPGTPLSKDKSVPLQNLVMPSLLNWLSFLTPTMRLWNLIIRLHTRNQAWSPWATVAVSCNSIAWGLLRYKNYDGDNLYLPNLFSFSTTHSLSSGCLRMSSLAVAMPTMPPPTTTMSYSGS